MAQSDSAQYGPIRYSALVTGATSGIGATYARKLAERGYDLLLVARDAAKLETKSHELTGRFDVSVNVLQADLTDPKALEVVVERLECDMTIRVLVNNAGVGPKGRLIDDDPFQLDAMLKLNVFAVHRLAFAAAKAFQQRGGGTIVNISSVVALLPERFHGTYSATKAFVLNLSQALDAEMNGTGVKVQAVLPGMTRTEIFERAGGDPNALDPSMVMDVNDMVTAALAGLDRGEPITIPSLEDMTYWNAIVGARAAIAPFLSLDTPARRYSET